MNHFLGSNFNTNHQTSQSDPGIFSSKKHQLHLNTSKKKYMYLNTPLRSWVSRRFLRYQFLGVMMVFWRSKTFTDSISFLWFFSRSKKIWSLKNPKITMGSMSSWRFGSDHVPFYKLGVEAVGEPAVNLPGCINNPRKGNNDINFTLPKIQTILKNVRHLKHVCQFGSSPHRVEHENCLTTT